MPPVMLMAQPLIRLNVMIPLTVDWLICSYEVQVELLRSVQPPLEECVMPAADSWLAAWAWVSLVAAKAGLANPTVAATATATIVSALCIRMRPTVGPGG